MLIEETVIICKSVEPHLSKEQDDKKKNNTEREDFKDERQAVINESARTQKFPWILPIAPEEAEKLGNRRIMGIWELKGTEFQERVRKIRDLDFWKGLTIITWDEHKRLV